jgi:hypothetical protein
MICRKMNKSLPVFIAALTLHQVIHNRLVGELNEGRITEDEFARRMKDEAGISVIEVLGDKSDFKDWADEVTEKVEERREEDSV